jgi:hypothetical protein
MFWPHGSPVTRTPPACHLTRKRLSPTSIFRGICRRKFGGPSAISVMVWMPAATHRPLQPVAVPGVPLRETAERVFPGDFPLTSPPLLKKRTLRRHLSLRRLPSLVVDGRREIGQPSAVSPPSASRGSRRGVALAGPPTAAALARRAPVKTWPREHSPCVDVVIASR